jgi:hypothetical protein
MARRLAVVDLTLLSCLDDGHRWIKADPERETKGRYRGSVRRERICGECGGVKIEHFGWDGTVLSRRYKSAPEYITEARKLGDPSHRRMNMRKLMFKSAK